jgi:UDP-N-acetylmuramate--alanine ligase
LSEAAELRAQAVNFLPGSSTFRVSLKGEELGEVKLLVPGWQNILNSLAVVYVGLLNNLDFNAIASSLHSFRGAKRRFQLIGEVGGIKIFDDYAHHPTEIKLTLQGARLNYPEARVICVFQPHRFSRTLHLYKKFGEAFGGADLVIVTDIYGAGEKPIEGISGQIIVDEIQKAGRPVIYLPRKEKIAEYLLAEMRPGDLVLLAGAGDIYTVAKELFSRLRIRENADTTP